MVLRYLPFGAEKSAIMHISKVKGEASANSQWLLSKFPMSERILPLNQNINMLHFILFARTRLRVLEG